MQQWVISSAADSLSVFLAYSRLRTIKALFSLWSILRVLVKTTTMRETMKVPQTTRITSMTLPNIVLG